MFQGKIVRESTDYCNYWWIGDYTRVVVYHKNIFRKKPLFTYVKKQHNKRDFYTEIRYYPLPWSCNVDDMEICKKGIVVGYRQNFFFVRDYQNLK